MHYSRNVVLAVAPFLLGSVTAVGLDLDDVPNPCKTICKPISTLSDKCDVDLRSDIDKDENHLQNQCICTNKSFDVGKIAAMCADCMHQTQKTSNGDDDDDGDNHADADDLKDIDGLLSVCGFSSTQYNSADASGMVASITVDVTRPTDISQLTTTIDTANPGMGGGGGGNGGSMQTSMMNSGSMMSSGSMMPTPTPTGGGGSGGAGGGSGNDNDNDNDGDDNNQSGGGGGSGGAASSSPATGAGALPTGNALYAGGIAYAAYLMG